MVQHEPCWRSNTSFSPNPSRWEFSFPSDDLPYDSHDGYLWHGSSTSSSGKEHVSMGGDHLYYHHSSSADSTSLFLSSPSDLSLGPQWTPPEIQEIHADDYETATRRRQVMQQWPSTPHMEGTSGNQESRGSTSSCSDESEPMFKSWLSSHRNFSGCRPFLSKPVHPLFIPTEASREASETQSTGFSKFDAPTLQKDAHRWSSASSSMEFSDISNPFESEVFGQLYISSDGFICGLCKRLLSQRSPLSTRRIVRSGDMPVAGVLSCRHVFHAECLEQTTPKAHRSDPPCPTCVKLEERNSPDLRFFSRLRNSFPSLRPSSDIEISESLQFMRTGDHVEEALHAPQRTTMLLLNQNRMRKNLSLKSNSSKEFPGKLRKSGTYSSKLLSGKSVDLGTLGSSNSTSGPSMNS